MLLRVATLACLVVPLTTCAALRSEGDACAIPTDENPCPWGQTCCVTPDCVTGCVGTCHERCPGPPDPPSECELNSECNDDDVCTEDTCTAAGCTNVPVAHDQDCETATGVGGRCMLSGQQLSCFADLGQECYQNTDCANDNCLCIDPECTERQCSPSVCSVCEFAPTTGTCTNMPDGAPDPQCAPFVCSAGGCLSGCGVNEDCVAGTRCDLDSQCVD
jgi:hypothetical protein